MGGAPFGEPHSFFREDDVAGQKPGGIGQYFEGAIGDPGRVLIREVYASTCRHCGEITEFASQRSMMDHVEICRGCMSLICLRCYGQPCVPAEKRAEMMEREAQLRRRLAQDAWGCY